MPLQVGSKNFAEFTVMMHGTTSGGAVPIFISSYVLLASFVVYLAPKHPTTTQMTRLVSGASPDNIARTHQLVGHLPTPAW